MSGSTIEIVEVTRRADKRAFLKLPWEFHKTDPNWVPPLRQNQAELVGYKKHPFHDDADVKTYLAKRDGNVVGRIAAIVDHAHNRYYDEKLGFFGFFESVDDTDVSQALFAQASSWLKSQGMTAVRGPVNPSMNYECGMLIEGFDSPPTFMMTYNPEYYPQLVEDAGFEKSQDLYAFWGHVDMLEELDKKLKFVATEAARRFGVDVRSMDTTRFHEEVRTFLDIYNRSLPGQWGFVPLSDGELEHMAKSLRHLIVPEMTSITEVKGEPVGVVFGLLDYNPRIKQIDGRLFPFGFIKLLRNKRELKRVRLISTNVLPQYQGWGLGLVLMNRLLTDALDWGIQEAEFSWVLESNKLSRGSLERGGAKRTKMYRIYDKPL